MSLGIKDTPWQCCCKPRLGPLCGECIEGALTAAVSLSGVWQLNIMMAQTSCFLPNNAVSLFARSCLLSLIFFFFFFFLFWQQSSWIWCSAATGADKLLCWLVDWPTDCFCSAIHALCHAPSSSIPLWLFPEISNWTLINANCLYSISLCSVCARMFVSLESTGASAPPTLIQRKFFPSFYLFLSFFFINWLRSRCV